MCAGFNEGKARSGETMLDSPDLVGVRRTVLLSEDEGLPAVEVQCCRVGPGGTGLLVTGLAGELVPRCRALVRHVDARLDALGALCPGRKLRPLADPKHDLHIHVDGPHAAVTDQAYLAAVLVSMVSLAVGRRPEGDVAVVAVVDEQRGRLQPCNLTARDMKACELAGVKRLIVHPDTVLPPPPHQVELLRLDEVTPMLAALFPPPAEQQGTPQFGELMACRRAGLDVC
jgi:hypothetical protein